MFSKTPYQETKKIPASILLLQNTYHLACRWRKAKYGIPVFFFIRV